MMPPWKILGFPAILAVALAITPEVLRAADPEKDKAPPPPATAKDLDKIDQTLQKMGGEIARDIDNLRKDFTLHVKKTQADIEALKTQVDQLRKDLDGLKKGPATVSNYGPSGMEIDELRKQLDQVQQTLNAIRGQLPTTSTSLRPVEATGRIRLVNDYPYATEVVVNGAGYLVEPGMTRELNLPAGPFVYRVPGAGIADQNRTLASGQTYTITVFPR